MLNRNSALALMAALFAVCAPAQAQFGPVDTLVEDVVSVAGLGDNGKRKGHEECNGNGHENGNGNGHEEGECDEEEPVEPTPTGPVGETVCASVDPESAYQRYSCEISIVAENYVETTSVAVAEYSAEVSSYAEQTIASVVDYADGALGLVVPIGPPQPPVTEALLADPVNYTTAYSVDYAGTVRAYAEQTIANVIDYADGALGLVVPIGPPQPPVNEGLIADPVGTLSAYTADVGAYAEQTTANFLDYADGALGLVVPIGPPQPPVTEALVAQPVEYTRDYAIDNFVSAGNYAATTGDGVMDYANGALGLVVPIGPPQPPVKETVIGAIGAVSSIGR